MYLMWKFMDFSICFDLTFNRYMHATRYQAALSPFKVSGLHWVGEEFERPGLLD